MPSGHFMADAAWLALTVMAHNLGRAVAILAAPDLERATAATLRRKVFPMPGRLVHTGRQSVPATHVDEPAFGESEPSWS